MKSATVKNFIFRVSGRLLRRGPLSPLARRYFRRRAGVVFYHGIWRDDCAKRRLFGGMRVSDFAREMERLSRFFEIIPLSQIANSSDRPQLSVTFDDGLDLTSSGATDVMDRLGIRATMFVNTASLAGGHLMWMHRFAAIRAERGDDVLLREINHIQQKQGGAASASIDELIATTRAWPQEWKEEWVAEIWERAQMPALKAFLAIHRPYLTVDGLRDWLRRGHEVGFHTHSHPFCSRLSDELLERELIDPISNFKFQMGLDRLPFAYPFGDRCRPPHERRLHQSGLFTALIGTAGFSPRGADPNTLERVEGEPDVDREIFGKPILRSLRDGN